jgi:hypothetical protein
VPNDWLTADREQIRKAREAAEALFKPKQHRRRPEPPPTVHGSVSCHQTNRVPTNRGGTGRPKIPGVECSVCDADFSSMPLTGIRPSRRDRSRSRRPERCRPTTTLNFLGGLGPARYGRALRRIKLRRTGSIRVDGPPLRVGRGFQVPSPPSRIPLLASKASAGPARSLRARPGAVDGSLPYDAKHLPFWFLSKLFA